MPQIKVILVSSQYLDEDDIYEHIKDDITDWEEITTKEFDVINRNKYELKRELNIPNGYQIHILVKADKVAESIKTTVARIVEKLNKQEEKRKKDEAASEAKKAAAKKKRELKKLEELSRKYDCEPLSNPRNLK